jgi:hypothetical protein
VAFEAKHRGMLSLDVIIVRKENLERHMASRYVIKYEPCVTWGVQQLDAILQGVDIQGGILNVSMFFGHAIT